MQYRKEEITQIKHKLATLDCLVDTLSLSTKDCLERGSIQEKIKQLDFLEVVDLKQRAKLKWVTEGDENIHFFYCVINGRRRSNQLHGLAVNDAWINDPNTLKNMAFEFFKCKIQEVPTGRTSFRSNLIRKLLEVQRTWLEAPFSEAENKAAVWILGQTKRLARMGSRLGS